MENLVSKLMKLDRDKLREVPTEKVLARRLSEVMGEPVEVTIKALPGDIYMELSGESMGDNGRIDTARVYNVQVRVLVEAVVEPNLKDHELQEYFGAKTPAELAKTLFPGGELSDLANRVGALSGFVDYGTVKN